MLHEVVWGGSVEVSSIRSTERLDLTLAFVRSAMRGVRLEPWRGRRGLPILPALARGAVLDGSRRAWCGCDDQAADTLLLLCRPQHERVTILPVHHPDGLAGRAARGVRGGRRGHGRREEDRGHTDCGHGRAGIALRDQGLR